MSDVRPGQVRKYVLGLSGRSVHYLVLSKHKQWPDSTIMWRVMLLDQIGVSATFDTFIDRNICCDELLCEGP